MNIESLNYFAKSINELFNVQTMIYQRDNGKIESSFLSISDFANDFLLNSKIANRYLGSTIFKDKDQVSYYISDDKIAFACINDKSSIYNLYIGPCLLADPSEEMMKTMLTRYNSPFKNNPNMYYDQVYNYIKSLPKFTYERFLWLISFSNNCINQEIIKDENIKEASLSKNRINIKEKSINNVEENVEINFSNIEQIIGELKALILTGSYNMVEEYWSNTSSIFFKAFKQVDGNADKLRYYKNIYIQFITHLGTIISNNNISSKQIFTLINDYTDKVEDSIMFQQIETLYRKVILELTNIVHKMNIENFTNNLLVNKAINYIHDNINKPINAFDIADNLNISRGYLSNIFNKTKNTSISNYINKAKIDFSKDLLKNTDNSIADISNYLSFSSQSYFQNIFKKFVGTTPLKFRQNNEKL